MNNAATLKHVTISKHSLKLVRVPCPPLNQRAPCQRDISRKDFPHSRSTIVSNGCLLMTQKVTVSRAAPSFHTPVRGFHCESIPPTCDPSRNNHSGVEGGNYQQPPPPPLLEEEKKKGQSFRVLSRFFPGGPDGGFLRPITFYTRIFCSGPLLNQWPRKKGANKNHIHERRLPERWRQFSGAILAKPRIKEGGLLNRGRETLKTSSVVPVGLLKISRNIFL